MEVLTNGKHGKCLKAAGGEVDRAHDVLMAADSADGAGKPLPPAKTAELRRAGGDVIVGVAKISGFRLHVRLIPGLFAAEIGRSDLA